MAARPLTGVAVIITRDDKVLLMKRQNSHGAGTWAPPGGHIEFGESLEACTIREVEEEMGLAISEVTFVAITNDVFEKEQKHYITIWMEGKHVAGEPRINAPREMSEIGWFSWSNLPQPLFLPLENLLTNKSYPIWKPKQSEK